MKSLKILFFSDRIPLPLNNGSKIRSFNLVKWLSADHRVDFLGFYSNDEEQELAPQLGEFADRLEIVPRKRKRSLLDIGLNLFSRKALTMVDYESLQMLSRLSAMLEVQGYDVVIFDLLHTAQYAPKVRFRGVSLYSSHNIESEIIKGVAETDESFAKRFYARILWRRLETMERRLWRHFPYAAAVTDRDAAEIARHSPSTKGFVVPNGVDCDHFRPDGRKEEGLELVHFATMDWLPNIQAMLWFYREMYPLIKREVPEARFTIGGPNPAPEIRALAESDPSVTVTGRVPDTQSYLKRAALSVVPLRAGSGSRLKILEAMAVGLPVVSTSVGADGLNVTPGHDIAIGDTPEEFARVVVDLLRDPAKRDELRRNGRALVEREYDWKQIVAGFSQQLSEIVS